MLSGKVCTRCRTTYDSQDGNTAELCPACATAEVKASKALTSGEEVARTKELVFGEAEPDSDPDLPPALGIGLRNRYQVVRELGNTLFSQVLLAHDSELGRDVVIKYLNLSTRFEHVERFKREAQLVANVKHPNVVRLYDFGVDEGRLYMVMEFIEGLALDVFSARLRQGRDEPRRIRRIMEVICDICYGLEYLHAQGIIHRDIKPANILLDRLGKPYLIDFGIAKRVTGQDMLTVDGEVIGTVVYMSPEQVGGQTSEIDLRSDVYSLGVMMYHLLTGQLPFAGSTFEEVAEQIGKTQPDSPGRLNPEIPTGLDRVIMRSIEKDKTRRYQSAQEMAKDLESLVRPTIIRPVPRRQSFYSRNKIRMAIALNALALGLVGWTIAPMFGRDSPPPVPKLQTGAAVLYVLREQFNSSLRSSSLQAIAGETIIDRGILTLRSAAVSTRTPVSSSDDFQIELSCAEDSEARPESVLLELFSDAGRGYTMTWDRDGKGALLRDGQQIASFDRLTLGTSFTRIMLSKEGRNFRFAVGEKVLIEQADLLSDPRTGVIMLRTRAGSLHVDSLMILVTRKATR